MTEIRANVVLTDIEGTTTSISFVKDVLFPYAKEHSKAYLQEHWDDPSTKTLLTDLTRLPQYKQFTDALHVTDEPSIENISNFVNYLIDRDLKLGPLKTLQGYVWETGYANGTIKGHVYADVPAALQRWQASGLKVAIYSSGSVKAQKLLFGQTEHGDLLPYIMAHFDTAIGHKQEETSYTNIARELGEACGDILFLTDIVKEAEAAHAAGMQTVILHRPGNAPLSDEEKRAFIVVENFDALKLLKVNPQYVRNSL